MWSAQISSLRSLSQTRLAPRECLLSSVADSAVDEAGRYPWILLPRPDGLSVCGPVQIRSMSRVLSTLRKSDEGILRQVHAIERPARGVRVKRTVPARGARSTPDAPADSSFAAFPSAGKARARPPEDQSHGRRPPSHSTPLSRPPYGPVRSEHPLPPLPPSPPLSLPPPPRTHARTH